MTDTAPLIFASIVLLLAITVIGGRTGADKAEREFGPLARQSWTDVVVISLLITAALVGVAVALWWLAQ